MAKAYLKKVENAVFFVAKILPLAFSFSGVWNGISKVMLCGKFYLSLKILVSVAGACYSQ